MPFKQDYTLGRGKVYFARFQSGLQLPASFRYIGNSPEFNVSVESENLDHFSSDAGIREKDLSIALEVTRTGSLQTDNINMENLALFLFGSTSALAQAAVPSATESFLGVNVGATLKLGVTAQNITGYMGIDPTGFAVQNVTQAQALVVDVDWVMDYDTGNLHLDPESPNVAEGDAIDVTYAVSATSRTQVASGNTAVEGAMQYVADNPEGTNKHWYMPWIKVTPNGDFALKGDEWQVMPFNIEVLKLSSQPAFILDGVPA